MNRIDKRFRELRQAGRTGLIPYLTAGYPDLESTRSLLPALRDAGADLIELGLPFSDPMADGPVIQRACEAAVRQGVGVTELLELVREFRGDDQETPLVVMGYLNPIVRFGVAEFAEAAASAGVDGLLMVDAPPEEAEIVEPVKRAGIHPIYLLAPTSSEHRIARVAEHAGGFVYYVSLTGITGADNLRTEGLAARAEQIRTAIDLPLAVGFGIKTPEHAAAVAAVSDAVVIGSALVERLGSSGDAGEAARIGAEFLAPIRSALDASRLEKTG
ncbi:MAG: tryptophan synthase subunit alpha [Xanthomonadales bacterium]|nr:tryptophan synthase subunit alpha [Xanthomonadales bacterium]